MIGLSELDNVLRQLQKKEITMKGHIGALERNKKARQDANYRRQQEEEYGIKFFPDKFYIWQEISNRLTEIAGAEAFDEEISPDMAGSYIASLRRAAEEWLLREGVSLDGDKEAGYNPEDLDHLLTRIAVLLGIQRPPRQ